MTYRLVVTCTVGNFADGGGQIGTTPNGPILELFQTEIVPGAQAPSGANFTTALNNLATDLGTQITANLSQIQGFATGGN
jgi:hypothetical protein